MDPSEKNEMTLFVGNLSHKVKSDEMRSALFEMFCPYGNILEIKLRRREKLTKVGIDKKTKTRYAKGMPYLQCIAFVVYEDKNSALNGQRLNGLEFFGRKMIVSFARKKSHVVALRDGTYKPKAVADASENQSKILIKRNKPEEEAADQQETSGKLHTFGEPSNCLFVENIGPRSTGDLLTPLFEQYPGFESVKHNNTTMTLFVYFEDIDQATQCLQEIHGFKVDPHHGLLVSFGR